MNKSPKIYRFFKDLPETLKNMRKDIQISQNTLYQHSSDLSKLEVSYAEIKADLEKLQQKQADIAHLISSTKIKAASKQGSSGLQADNHALDSYYLAFETKFRGSEEVIYNRLKTAYSEFIEELPKKVTQLPIIDIGCGRGELLRLYKESGLQPIGLDLNDAMVSRCKEMGLEAKAINGLDYLKKCESQSIGGISGIHLAEHIPFESLVELVTESYRVLVPGGFLLFETPNPENVDVGSHTFWYDSSHMRPMPPDVLGFLFEYIGFKDVKIMRLHKDPIKMNPVKNDLMKLIVHKFYGPRDYAAIGRKFSS